MRWQLVITEEGLSGEEEVYVYLFSDWASLCERLNQFDGLALTYQITREKS